MAKPPAGSSLLFGALADSGQIKQRKNGSYRMVLKGVDEIDWFTDRPFRAEKKQRAAASKWGMKYEDYAAKSAKELSRMRAWVRRHPGKVATDYFNR